MENSSSSEDLENGDRTVPVSSTPLAAGNLIHIACIIALVWILIEKDREDDEEHYNESDSTLLVPITEPIENDEYLNHQKWLIWKNVVVIGVSFMCLFTAFSVATVLQVHNSLHNQSINYLFNSSLPIEFIERREWARNHLTINRLRWSADFIHVYTKFNDGKDRS